ncbi:hypothetical protein [Bacillus infantis]|uniref:hypothetical protein n=1 Tax=Bacillus infantis TaxID=324767 RepID=UPI000928145F|nr:hypothetical protein [Bacillus infantis]MCA1035665.1 hypothetical protein [Bacillus infantis]SIC42710.1 Uncharacterised protein [Mycobacteroides abscessus subsp. abscessus]
MVDHIVEAYLLIVFMIPVYALLLWTYFNAEESMLWGKRWMYSEEPEVSEAAIRYTKFASVFMMIALPVFILLMTLDIGPFRLGVVILPVVFVIGALRIYTDEKD